MKTVFPRLVLPRLGVVRHALVLGALLTLTAGFAQPDNPFTLYRMLEVPIVEGPVERVAVRSSIDGEPFKTETWTFGADGVPLRRVEETRAPGGAFVEEDVWTADEDGFPVRIDRSHSYPPGLDDEGFVVRTTVDYRRTPSGYEAAIELVFPGEDAPLESSRRYDFAAAAEGNIARVEMVGPALGGRPPERSITRVVFDPQWRSRESATTLRLGAREVVALEAVMDASNAPRRLRMPTLEADYTIVARDAYGNPLRALATSSDGTPRSIAWEYDYRSPAD